MSRRARVPRYCLHKSSGHARVRVDGREIFLGPYNSPESLERYQRIVAELVASRASKPEAVHPDGPTVVEVLAAYLAYAER